MAPRLTVHEGDEGLTIEPTATPTGSVELVVDREHFERIVLGDLRAATVSIDIATADFKAMLVPTGRSDRRADSIVALLRAKASDGVEVRVLHAGVPSTAARAELHDLPENLRVRRCPRLHAKAVIVDSRTLYLGSANLTGAGLGAKAESRRNFEWGVRSGSAELIDGVAQQFNALWEGRHCAGCGRREVCPVPLESPDLGVG
jgi:phosphatidylserine/phosphatidylglycerophosphate/cardiolipin synthase-like enzyme